ncbi:MAG: hypothetical protein AAGU75_01810 [Bacillota bacterium]
MIKVLLTDRDKEYGKALTKAISNLHNEFEVSVYSLNEDDSNEYEFSIDSYDLYLIGGYLNSQIESFPIKNLNKNKAVILTEYQVETILKQTAYHTDDYWYLYKYVKIDEIISDLNYIIGFISGKKSVLRKSQHTNIIGFYSISGGAGKSVISIGTSRELCRYHDKKVLYMSFEEIPATELYIKYNFKNRNIGDYLYYLLKKQNENICSHLDGFTVLDEFGVEFFPSSNGRNDLNCLTKDELTYLVKVLSDSCRYDYIIFDLNNDLSEETLLLMDQCCKIIIVQNKNLAAVYKCEKMFNYLRNINSFHFQDRLFCVTNKIEASDNNLFENQGLSMKSLKNIFIERDENSFRVLDDHLDFNINHSFGIGIKQITDEIILSEIKSN